MDEYDKLVIYCLHNDGPMTLRCLVGCVFEAVTGHDIKKKSNCLRYRMEKLVDGDLVVYDKKGKLYSLAEHDAGIGMMILTKLDGSQLGLATGETVFFHLPCGGDRIIFLDGEE